MNSIQKTRALGQSLWYDDISADALADGLLQEQRDLGVTGVTSNPAIFKKAILSGRHYRPLIAAMPSDLSDEEVLEQLMVADVRAAADLFADLYRQTEGVDGYVSLEVSPLLAHDRAAQREAGLRIFARIGRPNGMIKVPATPAGIGAIEDLIAEGVNVNATLIFSPVAYRAVAEAFLKGLERWCDSEKKGPAPAGVASVFVSRLDSAVDKQLAQAGLEPVRNCLGIDNCRLIYQDFRRLFSGARWERLAAKGCGVQRPLWASTSVKTDALTPTAYVEALIGPDTVNTVPPATLKAFMAVEEPKCRIEEDVPLARARLGEVVAAGIDLDGLFGKLLADGLEQFVVAYNELLDAVKAAR